MTARQVEDMCRQVYFASYVTGAVFARTMDDIEAGREPTSFKSKIPHTEDIGASWDRYWHTYGAMHLLQAGVVGDGS